MKFLDQAKIYIKAGNGASGGDTSNTGDGGDAGAAITPSGITVTGTINSNTIKGSY